MSLSGPWIVHLYKDFKITGFSCCIWGAEAPFETFKEVGGQG